MSPPGPAPRPKCRPSVRRVSHQPGRLRRRGHKDGKGVIMRVFVAGATGVIGRFLVPGLIAAGHEVIASTRSVAKAGQLATAGATPVVVDGLDRGAVLEAV